jgi:hypothetical protein
MDAYCYHVLLYVLPSNGLLIQKLYIRGQVFTEPLLSSWWFLDCDRLALDLLWLAPKNTILSPWSQFW